MKIINTTLTAVILMGGLFATAQNKDTKTADKHFKEFKYIKAIDGYNKLVENGKADEYVYSRLAEANYNIFNTEESEKWYAKTLETSQDTEVMYNYAQMLKANGKYDKANVWMQKFATANPNDDRAKIFKSNPDYIPGILGTETNYELANKGFNSAASDFGGTVKDGVLYFTSARNDSRKNYGWNDQPFLDLYQVALETADGSAPAAETVNGINTKYHEGVITFSPDGNTAYFSRESFSEGVYEKDEKLKISYNHLYRAKKDGNKWGSVEALPFNGEFSSKNPSLSADGSTLYFASDREGGKGGFDIYKVSVNGNSYGEPENVSSVNTEGQEMFPFISDDNSLYFSSTGHLGLGGLDVFYVENGSVKNIGVPVNSEADDFAFTINEDTGKGYVSSNREGGQGDDDVYGVTRTEPCMVDVTAQVVDAETGAPLQGATIVISDSKSTLSTLQADASGKANYTANCGKTITVEGSIDGYEAGNVDYTLGEDDTATVQLELNPIEKLIVEDRVVLNPIYFEFDKANITEQGAFELDKLVAVMNKHTDMVIRAESHTDKRGSAKYNMQLSDRRAKSTAQYVISKGIDASRITGVGKGEAEPKVECSKCTEEQHDANRRSEFVIVSGGPNQQ